GRHHHMPARATRRQGTSPRRAADQAAPLVEARGGTQGGRATGRAGGPAQEAPKIDTNLVSGGSISTFGLARKCSSASHPRSDFRPGSQSPSSIAAPSP